MTAPMITSIVIFLAMIVSFAIGKLALGVTAGTAAVLLVLTGCLDASSALSGFGNANVIIIVGMFVLGAGLKKTSLIGKIGAFIRKVTGGSFKWAYRGIIVLGVIVTSFITSPAVSYSIVMPLMDSVCEEFDVSPSKVQFPLALTCVACCAILPFGFAISEAAVFAGLMETYGFTQTFVPMDFTIGRWPMLIMVLLWAWFIGPKVTPEKPVVPLANVKKADAQPLSKGVDLAGSIIFIVTILCLVFNAQIGVAAWVIVLAGCMAFIIAGVLSSKEAIGAMAIDLGFLFVGANAMASALVKTGTADYVGGLIADLLGANPNPWLLSVIFFVVPFVLTQFMQNQGVMNIFAPIALLTCSAIGADPRGCLVLICAGSLTAFMTPAATSAIPIVMGAGGYDIKTLIKLGWLFAVLAAIVYIPFVTLVMPAF